MNEKKYFSQKKFGNVEIVFCFSFFFPFYDGHWQGIKVDQACYTYE